MAVDDSYTKSLLHFTGADNSTTFTDESGKTWTARNGAKIKTDAYKFQPSSFYNYASNPYIDTPNSSDFDISTGDFTIDFWMYSLADFNESSKGILFKGNTLLGSDYDFEISSNAGGNPSVSSMQFNQPGLNAYVYFYQNGLGWAQNTWNHYAVVKSGTTYSAYVDGYRKDTRTFSGTGNTTTGKLRLGNNTGSSFIGYIDEFRFSKGIARWTGLLFYPQKYPYNPPFSASTTVSKINTYNRS